MSESSSFGTSPYITGGDVSDIIGFDKANDLSGKVACTIRLAVLIVLFVGALIIWVPLVDPSAKWAQEMTSFLGPIVAAAGLSLVVWEMTKTAPTSIGAALTTSLLVGFSVVGGGLLAKDAAK